ncbi:MAG: hypothetical protein LBU32_01230 [Clostridiales bacterium]|nr:hypothetical protein [Clostridiales bacterium]
MLEEHLALRCGNPGGKDQRWPAGTELFGKTFGIVGFGAIGKGVAKVAQAFGRKAVAYEKGKNPGDSMDVVEFATLDGFLSESDTASLHVPLVDEARGLINKVRLSLMKSAALLINAARDPIVDSQVLADALNNDKLAGAVIDVFDAEPPLPASQPLLHAKNTVLAPPVGFDSKESMIRRAGITFGHISAWISGKPVNVKLGGSNG